VSLAARVEQPEGVHEQRQSQSAAAPARANADRSDPATAVAEGIAAGEAGDLVALARDRPHRRVEVLGLEARASPVLERERDEAELVGEGLHLRVVEGPSVVDEELLDPDAVRPGRVGRRIVAELDPHLVVVPHVPVATSFEKRDGSAVLREDVRSHRFGAELPGPRFGQLEERSAEAPPEEVRPNVAPRVRHGAERPERRRRGERSLVVDQPDVARGVGVSPPLADVVPVDVRLAPHGELREPGHLGDRVRVRERARSDVEPVSEGRAHPARPRAA
jgi:hypothetical protein